MPSAKLKPSDLAIEAKRKHIPLIERSLPNLPPQCVVVSHPETVRNSQGKASTPRKLRVAVIAGDPVDVALGWNTVEGKDASSRAARIPLVLPVDEQKAGGDWESGTVAPEENLSRRSNLVPCLKSPSPSSSPRNSYPMPLKGGLYAPHVVVFRSGPEDGHGVWPECKWLPVIAVAPVRRPRLSKGGEGYCFDQERELMKEKMRTVLRLAAAWHHESLCIGPFGAGPGFRNPIRELATMWKEILFGEREFQDAFTNIVFAFEQYGEGGFSSAADMEIFQQEFAPGNVFKTSYR